MLHSVAAQQRQEQVEEDSPHQACQAVHGYEDYCGDNDDVASEILGKVEVLEL